MATPKNQSVLKAFTLLRSFNSPDEWLTSSELSRRAKLPEASGYRLVQTLEGIGAIVRDVRGRYRPGMLMLSISRDIAPGDLWRQASQRILEGLAREWDASSYIGVFEESMVTYVAVAGRPSILTNVNTQLEAYCTGLGKVLLAALPDKELDAFLDEGDLVALTARTITDPAVLRAELQEVRAKGFAIDDGETLDDLRCLAAPIRNPSGEIVAAISVSADSSRLTPAREASLIVALFAAARAVGSKLYPWQTAISPWCDGSRSPRPARRFRGSSDALVAGSASAHVVGGVRAG